MALFNFKEPNFPLEVPERFFQILELFAFMWSSCNILGNIAEMVAKLPILNNVDDFKFPKVVMGGLFNRIMFDHSEYRRGVIASPGPLFFQFD